MSRGGPAAGGSFGRSDGSRGGSYRSRGRAADGDFGRRDWEEDREERVEERHERRTERREDLQEYVDEHGRRYYGGYYYDGEYYDGYEEGYDEGYDDALEEEVYYELPCLPVVKPTGGTVYYVCQYTYYVRVYVDGEVAYVAVPNPSGR